ncbi:MAG TPA: UDP-N-acetylmuramoyl-L-alanine--D-glutamate ligase [Bryobacteraceae bacterium]|nr:UDP-N-acetylmuramoyl-L-alanine--D-glutamate ligase [Bryobacteraceae bacterium]
MKHELSGRTVLVAGMGKSGLAAIDLLRKQGAHVLAADEKPRPDLGMEVLPQTAETFTRADLIVLSPGVPTDAPAVEAARQKGIPILGELELAGYFLNGPSIGITGANGKTTTTALIGHLLKECGIPSQVGGNIGTAPAAMVDASREDQWNVLELSSFQLETIDTFHAHIALCTNVTPDHLDRHHTFENYAAAKARLFETQRDDAHAVLNADDATCKGYARLTRAEVHWFSRCDRTAEFFFDGETLLAGRQPLLRAEDLPIRGVHNVENAMAASAAAHIAGAPLDGIAAALRTFPGVEHRLEFVRERNGVRYYNDSKATNVDATEKAIDAFPGNLWIILGGKDKNSDYTVLRDKLRAKAKGILLIGAAAGKIAGQLEGLPLMDEGTLQKAVADATSRAAAGDIILLAPACASFDQFDSYEHRGRVFKDLVRSL